MTPSKFFDRVAKSLRLSSQLSIMPAQIFDAFLRCQKQQQTSPILAR